MSDHPTYVFLDTETTSLRPDRRVWDIGAIVRGDGVEDKEFQCFVQIDELELDNADLGSLRIGKFFDRHPQAEPWNHKTAGTDIHTGLPPSVMTEASAMYAIEVLMRDAFIVGAVVNFDTEVLAARMRAHRLLPAWHYHLVDVENLAAGQLGMRPPWSFDQILAEYGIAVDEEKRHTALGDAAIARDLFDAVYSGQHWKVTRS